VLARLDANAAQSRTLLTLVRRAAGTAFGRAHGFSSIRSIEDYQRRVPLMNYDAFWKGWWEPAFPKLDGVSWPGPIRYFANTAGTTGATTKRIPLSREMLTGNSNAAQDVLAFHFGEHPQSRVLGGKSIFMAGSIALEELQPGIFAGDLSAISAIERPVWARGRVLPPDGIARIGDWQRKMEALARVALAEPQVKSISGTTSWMLLFFEVAAAMCPPGARLRDMFPALELIVHGGVAFAPYRDRFAYWMEGSSIATREVYPASEGFIAAADKGDGEGLRLMLDHGLFFEFVRPEDLGSPSPERRWIGNAELGREYAIVLSTNAGLWSYVIGDTVKLVSRDPPRLVVTGRTAWSLSVAGEHLVGSELDAAMSEAARLMGRNVVDYSAAPVPPGESDARAGHLFAVELDGPADTAAFAAALDAALKRLNEDYAAHREAGFGLRDPVVRLLAPGSFARWMAGRGKLGAQNKVPRVVASLDKLAGLFASDQSSG
jgi:hypothetical protein